VRYGHSTPGAPVEFVNLRLAAFGQIAGSVAPFTPPEGDGGQVAGTRTATFDGVPYETTILHRDRLRPEQTFEGPLVIEEQSSTTVIPPGHTVRVDALGNLLITTTDAEG